MVLFFAKMLNIFYFLPNYKYNFYIKFLMETFNWKKNFFIFFNKKNFLSLYILFTFFKFNIRSVRMWFCLPLNKQRTHSSYFINNSNKLILLDFLNKYHYGFLDKTLSNTQVKQLLNMEVFNKLWFFYWRKEWKLAFSKRTEYELKHKIFRKWKFNWEWFYLNRPILFSLKKVKINKKKISVAKGTFNIGFLYGFSENFQKSYININKIKRKKQLVIKLN